MNIEDRIERLEERLTWLQKHTTEQDRIISAQSFEIESLKKRLTQIKTQISEPGEPPAPSDERPPHY